MRSVVAGRMVTEGRGVVRHLAGCRGHRVVRLSSLFERLPVGVVGCSVLYHLVKHGWKDVALIERSELAARLIEMCEPWWIFSSVHGPARSSAPPVSLRS